MQSTEPVQASIKSWKFIDQIQPRGKMAEESEIQIRAVPHNAIGEEMLGKLLNLLHDRPLDQPLDRLEGVGKLERIAESQGLKFPKDIFLFLGLGHGKLFSHSNLNLDLEQISDLQKWANGMKNQEGVAYIIDSDLLEHKFLDSGFVSSHQQTHIKEPASLNSTEGTSSALNLKTANEHTAANGHADNDVDGTNRWNQMEQELQSKTQEILKLRETLVQKTNEKEKIQKLLELTQLQTKELGSSQRTQSEDPVVEESLENKRSGYNDDFDEVNSIKSEKDRTTSMSIRSLETCQLPKRKPNVETEFWSEDDEMVATNPIFETQTISCNQTGSDYFFPMRRGGWRNGSNRITKKSDC